MRNAVALGTALIALSVGASTISFAQDQTPDPAKGERLFRAQCASCHSFDPKQRRSGPHLLGVIGREAGSVEGFRYTKAMEEADLVWGEENLDAFLANPRDVVPKTNMLTRVSVARNRANIISFLATKTE